MYIYSLIATSNKPHSFSFQLMLDDIKTTVPH